MIISAISLEVVVCMLKNPNDFDVLFKTCRMYPEKYA